MADILELDEDLLNILFETYEGDNEGVNNDIIDFGVLNTSTSSNEENKSDRFRTVQFHDIEKFLEENENKNTKKKTKADIELIKSFLVTKNEMRDLECIPPTELNNYLSEFLLSVKKKDGNEYEPTTLRAFFQSTERYLKSKGYAFSVRDGIEFVKCRSVLTMKQKQLKSLGKGNKSKASDPLDDEMIDRMYESGTLGDRSPSALIHSMWLTCVTYFGMRTGQEAHTLRWGDVFIKVDDNGHKYLVYDTERQTKTRTGGNARDTRMTKPRAYELLDCPLKDPVRLYEAYMSRRPTAMLQEDSPFFLSVANKKPTSTQAWFKEQAMGINTIYHIMRDMKQEAGIESDKRITPYSARKHLIQKLNDQGVPAHQIVQISGHKNVNSINNYSKINPDQSRNISNIISNQPQNTMSNAMCSTPYPRTPLSDCRNFTPGPPQGMFYGSNFNGNVNFHFNSSSSTSNSMHAQLSQTAVLEPSSPPHRQWKRIKRCISSDSSDNE